MRFPSLFVVCLALLLIGRPAVARWDDPEAGRPVLETHALGHLSGVANYAMASDARGRIYAANDRVLEYDGVHWTAIPIGESNTVFCLAVDSDNRIWCGAVNELGYIDEDPTGRRSFHSLRPFLPAGLDSFFVYGVHRRASQTLFVLEHSILIWDGNRFELRDMPSLSRLNSFEIAGECFLSQKGTALWQWADGALSQVDLDGHEHLAVFGGWREPDGDRIFVTPESLVRRGRDRVETFAQATMHEIRAFGITAVNMLPDHTIAVSTRTAGIVVLGGDGGILRHLGRDAGLPALDCASQLIPTDGGRAWFGAFNHVVALDPANVQTLFNADNGNGGDAIGVAHSPPTGVISATAEGVHRLRTQPPQGASFEKLPGLISDVRDITSLPDGRLVATDSRRLLHLTGVGADPLLTTGIVFFQLAPLDTKLPRFAVGEGPRIALFDLARDEPHLGSLDGFPEYPVRLAGDGSGRLWASFRRSGVAAIERAIEATPARRHFEVGRDLPKPFHDPTVFVLGQQAYACASNAIVALPGVQQGKTRVVHAGTGLLAVERTAGDRLWAVAVRAGHEPRLVRIDKTDGSEPSLRVTDQVVRGITNITVLSRTQDHVVWIGGTDGSVRIDTREVRDEPPPRAPLVQSVLWRMGEEVTRLSLAAAPTVSFHRTGTIEFQLRDSGDPFAKTQLIETRLAGVERDWRPTGKARTIAGLDEGRYTFEARTVGFLGNPGPVVSYTFTILPPWFRTPLAYLAYVLAFGGSISGAVQWRTRRIRKQNAQLEQLVNRRTEELAQAVSARSAFLANMGHEIRNPLNGVVGLVDMLRSRQLAAENKALVDRIGTCADQLISVIDDVLEYARIDAGRIALRTRPFTVREPVEAAIDIFRAARPEAQIDLHGAPEDLDAHIIGDPDRIRHILVNYLANALKFGGGTPVDVGVRHDGALLVFSVTDRGPGIAADEQTRLFVRFSRGSLAYQQAIPGTGLGLAACKAYAEAMGGDVSVDSELGRGSTFFLRVPFQPATAAAAAPAPAAPDLLVGRRALVVDDQDFNRFVLCDLLGRMGASAAQAASIDEAREVFGAQPPDIVFVDFDLAGATGADLAEWIRKEAPAGRDVPIIATTAFEVDEVRRRCTEAAMDGFLAKPVTAPRLAEVVARIESVRSGGTPSPSRESAPPPASFLDILAGGDPAKRVEIERATWREVLLEALAAHRALHRGDAPLTARHAHRLVSAALMLGQRELVAIAREMNGQAKAGDLAATRLSADRLRQRIRSARHARGRPAAATGGPGRR